MNHYPSWTSLTSLQISINLNNWGTEQKVKLSDHHFTSFQFYGGWKATFTLITKGPRKLVIAYISFLGWPIQTSVIWSKTVPSHQRNISTFPEIDAIGSLNPWQRNTPQGCYGVRTWDDEIGSLQTVCGKHQLLLSAEVVCGDPILKSLFSRHIQSLSSSIRTGVQG
jgi:hypothetical protein